MTEDRASLRLLCSGAGRHRERLLATVTWHDESTFDIGHLIVDSNTRPASAPVVADWPRVLTGKVIPPDPTAASGSGISRASYRFRCPTCTSGGTIRTAPVINAERLRKILSEARRVGLRTLDVSALD